MEKILGAGAALLMTTGLASAGGLDRSGQDIGFIFEEGQAAELSFGSLNPTISSNPDTAAGDVGVAYTQLGVAYKQPLSKNLELAIIMDQPFGSDIKYGAGPLDGTEASVSSLAVTGLFSYNMNDEVTVYGGARLQSLVGSAAVPAAKGYTLETERSLDLGYVAGAAYEIPNIALRLALTYNSEIKHALESAEYGTIEDEFEVTTPQSINLDFQSGVAQDTLVFGSIRWVDWSEFDITPPNYPAGALVDYDDDVMTYTLGIGRRFSDTLSGSFSISYEETTGDPTPNLGPTDGYLSYQIGLERKLSETTTLSAGIRYVDIGDAVTKKGISFEDNSAIAGGVSIIHNF